MTNLEGCIRFWRSKFGDRGLYSPSTMGIIESTIKHLEKLQKLEKKEQ